MKCNQCGHRNKSGRYYCEKCGSPLSTNSYTKSPIRKYKDSAIGKNDKSTFNRKHKFIIAICIIGVVLLVLSSVVPSDLDFSRVTDDLNNTINQNQTPITDTNTQKISTKVTGKSVTTNGEGQIVLNAYVTDENDLTVNSGTCSIYVNGVKYSGQVTNGNANIVLPDNIQDTQVTLNYEGNEEYSPSQTTVYIELPKMDTKINIQNNNNSVDATLLTQDGDAIPNATIIITSENNNLTQTTDDTGKVSVTPQNNTTQITFKYEGSSKYNPTQNSIQLRENKSETYITAQYDEDTHRVNIKLVDVSNNPVASQQLNIKDNNITTMEETDTNGQCTINLDEGYHEILITYDGKENYDSSNDTINVNVTENTTDTTNSTNTTDTTNNTNTTSTNSTNTTKTDNNTTNTSNKSSSTITADINTDHTIVTAKLTGDDIVLSNEYITVTLDNGTQLSKKTDAEGLISISLEENTNITSIELSFKGNDKYNSTTKIFTIEEDNKTSSSHN